MHLLPSSHTLDLQSAPQLISNSFTIATRLGMTLPDGRRHFKLLYRSSSASLKSSSHDRMEKSMNNFNVIFRRRWIDHLQPILGLEEWRTHPQLCPWSMNVKEMKEGRRLWMERLRCLTWILCRDNYNECVNHPHLLPSYNSGGWCSNGTLIVVSE